MIWVGNDEYEVLTELITVIVQFNKAKYECGAWQLSGIPCKHAMACISYKGIGLVPYVHNGLTTTTYIHTYVCMVHPIPNELVW